MERIDASDKRVFAPISSSSSSPSTPLSLPASRSLYPAVAYDHIVSDAVPAGKRQLNDFLTLPDEDVNFFDSDVSSAASSCIPLEEDFSDENRPISPPRRPDKLLLNQKKHSPAMTSKVSPKKSPSPKKTPKKGVSVQQMDSERLARIRKMKFVRPSLITDRHEEEALLKDIY
jgi:hypothetical protein